MPLIYGQFTRGQFTCCGTRNVAKCQEVGNDRSEAQDMEALAQKATARWPVHAWHTRYCGALMRSGSAGIHIADIAEIARMVSEHSRSEAYLKKPAAHLRVDVHQEMYCAILLSR